MPEASGSADVGVDESDYSIFENKTGLGEDMKFLASMPELCDVTFLVGDTKEPICAVKAVLAARSKVFQRMFYQTASPQHKKEPPPKENKFRIFLKRSSEPLLNLQNSSQQRSGFAQQLAPIQEPDQHQTVDINEFEPDVFRQLIEYIHTGCVTLQPRTLLGLVNAADYYGLEQLRKACNGFVTCCITVDTVCALLATAERYIQYKCTKSYIQKVLEYVDDHGNEVLNLGSFTLLPQHVVCLILAREELKADEFTKFQAALMWSKKYCDNNPNQTLHSVIGTFLEYIEFHRIPANVLVKDINPLKLVPQTTIMTALAYQADPTCVDPEQLSPHRVKHHDRSLSVQSSLQDPLGSNTTLDSTVSNEGSDEKQRSGKYGTAEQETQEQREQQWQKQREDDENLQRLIEQRSQFQSMRQEEDINRHHEDHLTRSQEEELRKQEMQEEFERQKKRRKSEQKRMEEEAEMRRMEEELKQLEEQHMNREQEEGLKFQEQQQTQQNIEQKDEDLETQQQEKSLEQQQQDLKVKQEEGQEEQEGNEISKEEQDEAQQKEDTKQQIDEDELQQKQLTEIREPYQIEPEEKLQQRLEEEAQLNEEQELQKLLEAEKQRKLREERKLQLELQELKTQLTLQQELMFQKHEEALQRQIEKRRYEEESESWEFQLQQLQLEGRKPEAERKSEQRRKSKKRKSERAEIRVQEVESPKQEAPPVEGVAGFYIRLVVRQEGRANLVWLFKTHKF